MFVLSVFSDSARKDKLTKLIIYFHFIVYRSSYNRYINVYEINSCAIFCGIKKFHTNGSGVKTAVTE